MQAFNISLVFTLILIPVFSTKAQEIPLNRYGLKVIDDKKIFKATVAADSNKAMVELKSLAPGLVYELRYAGTDNFMKHRMYPARTRHTFLRLPAARALAAAQRQLNAQGYGLKIWDAYRPYSVTEQFWEMVKDERYAANPAKGSGHNRGTAVDLTLIELATGREVDMGTGFDNFSDTAHHAYPKLPATVQQARLVLRQAMEQHGFIPLATEWWHYSLPDARRYELLNISFKALQRLR